VDPWSRKAGFRPRFRTAIGQSPRAGEMSRSRPKSLARLFTGWGRDRSGRKRRPAVSWATLTGLIASMAESHVPDRLRLRQVLHPAFAGLYLFVNGLSFVLDRAERRFARSSLTISMNLLVTARRPMQSVVSRSEGTV
jgi:hypothetical protein